MRPGSGVHLSSSGAHDLPEATGDTQLAVGCLPQLPHPAGIGQPGGSVFRVEKEPIRVHMN